MSRAKCLVFGALLLLLAASRAARAADIEQAREALYASYAKSLDTLAAECRQDRLPEAAEELTGWLPKRAADQLTLFLAASTSPPSEAAADAEWQREWRTLRDAQADALFALARQALGQQRPSLAYELVIETVRENPDHKQARKMLGFVRYRDAWHTPFEIKQLGANKVWTETFGWLPKNQVERYEGGERYYQGRWMPADEEQKLRSDIKRGWRVESEHYVITTNHSLEEGVRLSQRLERLYGVWQQVFISYLTSTAELARRFEGQPAPREGKRHNVTYFRTRDEYNAALKTAQPQIEISLGIYFGDTHTAYFFAGEDQHPGTLYHEATHQLFQESRPVAPDVGRRDNFWIIEGIACYMESLAEQSGYYTLGGADSGRMAAARHRLLNDSFYVPLADLVRIGMDALQRDTRIARIYSQSAGLADFFMHDGGGRYREPLVRYLDAVYAGRATSQTLAEQTGADYPTLDAEYRAFMQQGQTVAAADAAGS